MRPEAVVASRRWQRLGQDDICRLRIAVAGRVTTATLPAEWPRGDGDVVELHMAEPLTLGLELGPGPAEPYADRAPRTRRAPTAKLLDCFSRVLTRRAPPE